MPSGGPPQFDPVAFEEYMAGQMGVLKASFERAFSMFKRDHPDLAKEARQYLKSSGFEERIRNPGPMSPSSSVTLDKFTRLDPRIHVQIRSSVGGNVLGVAVDFSGYFVDKNEAEGRLRDVLGEKGMPKLSEQAVEEYGEAVAIAGRSGQEPIGFAKFMEWGKRYDISFALMKRLNPTRRDIESLNGHQVISQADVSSPKVPNMVRNDRENGIA